MGKLRIHYNCAMFLSHISVSFDVFTFVVVPNITDRVPKYVVNAVYPSPSTCLPYTTLNSSLLAYPTEGQPLLYPNRALSSHYPTATLTYSFPTPTPTPSLPYPTLTLPYPTLTLPYLTLPYPIQPYPTLPYPTLPYPTLPYPNLPYPKTLEGLLQDIVSSKRPHPRFCCVMVRF